MTADVLAAEAGKQKELVATENSLGLTPLEYPLLSPHYSFHFLLLLFLLFLK